MQKRAELLEARLHALKGAIRDSSFAHDVLQKSHDWLATVSQEQRTKELDKLQGEICYLLARELKQSNRELAKRYAEEAVTLYEKMSIQSLEEAAPIFWEKLPDQMHEGVVRNILQEVL